MRVDPNSQKLEATDLWNISSIAASGRDWVAAISKAAAGQMTGGQQNRKDQNNKLIEIPPGDFTLVPGQGPNGR